MSKALEYILSLIDKRNYKYEIHKFDSGAIMIDLWMDDLFYVVQIENGKMGWSLVNENSGFDTIPDNQYDDFESFKDDFERHLKG